MSENELRLLLVEHWVEIAEEDYWAARMALHAAPPRLSVAGFTTQQMTEKYLKAYLELHGVEFPRTHDLRALLVLCADIDEGFAALSADAAALDEVGITPRYPPVRLTKEKAAEGLRRAEAVRAFVLPRLPATVAPPGSE
jgi:HEPN domain-containing protein